MDGRLGSPRGSRALRVFGAFVFEVRPEMRRRNRLKALGMATLLSAGAAYALASWDWCRRPASAPRVVSRLQASGPLSAGAARVELKPPYPVVAAGYGPARPELKAAVMPLEARAVVLSEGDVTFGVVSLDLLLIPDEVAREVREKSGLTDAWVVATHSHTSFGGYDGRWAAQLAGTGRFRSDAREAVVTAAVEALRGAAAQLRPVELEVASADAGLSAARSGAVSDERLVRVRFGDVAQWLMLAAHPTLVPRKPAALDPDYPGVLAARGDAGVTLVLQLAVGNAMAVGDSPAGFAAGVGAAFDALEGAGVEAPSLTVTRVELTPPPPDASRLVPALFTMPGRNFLCVSSEKTAEVGVLKLGTLVIAAVPVELTYGAARELGEVPVLSLANGYLGYVEPASVVDAREGEAKRQYYDRMLLERLKAALVLGGL